MMSPSGTELPDPFFFGNATRVRMIGQWRERRREIHDTLLPLVYGDLPPAPAATRCVELHTAIMRRLGNARLVSCRVETDGRHAFTMRVFAPAAPTRCPVVLNGDGCWHYAGDEVIAAVLGRGYAFAQFNRVEIAPDLPAPKHSAGPGPILAGRSFAALAKWAWGYHRAVDALLQMDFVDPRHVAVVGHSRGGKAALLAGAMDERIALTSANNSGAGGAGSFRYRAQGAETLGDITRMFPHWFSPGLRHYADREASLPFDQHFLKALIAPRALLTTEALGDHWANPAGAWQTHLAAREVYAFLGAEERIAIAFREGGHDHATDDWNTLLDFCDSVFRRAARKPEWDKNPFPDVAKTFSWRCPGPV